MIRVRIWVVAAVLVLTCGGLAAAALIAWPRARLGAADDALARIVLPAFAGRVTHIEVRSAGGPAVPVQLRHGKVWPLRRLDSGVRLTVSLTVTRPGWAGWLVGSTERRSFTIATPRAHLRGRWLQVKTGAPVTVAFDSPVRLVALGGAPARRLSRPRVVVPVGLVARGSGSAGTVEVAAAARSWERLPAPVRVSWFPARAYPQLLAEPRPGARLIPGRQLTLTFSSPVRDALGTRRPRLSPATPGLWRQPDAHTLTFQPAGLGFGLGAHVQVELPRAAHLATRPGTALSRTLRWRVPDGSVLRLQQLFAELGYLPLDWYPSDPGPTSARAELAAALKPPPGRFSWRYAQTPPELRALWQPGQPNEITRGAVMRFEDTHGLAVDGFAGPKVWRALIADEVAGRRRSDGYSFVFVHRHVPQSLNLWHDGQVILSSPGNTGVPAAPTQLGTWPVFEHIPVGTMSGTNPNGSHYHDPGIRYISYFHGGDAIHAFNRASFGTPQSLGCVELPLAAAEKVWPYTPIGTLVTIEN
jgi:hypothetical protein